MFGLGRTSFQDTRKLQKRIVGVLRYLLKLKHGGNVSITQETLDLPDLMGEKLKARAFTCMVRKEIL
jgi:hypothetical protein